MEAAPVNEHNPSRSTAIAEFLITLILVLLVVTALATIVSTVVGLASGGNTLLGRRTLPIHAELPSDQVRPLPHGVRLTRDAAIIVDVRDPSATQLLLSTSIWVGPFLLLVGALSLLRGLARSVKKGDPFGRENVQRLRRIGFLLVVGGPVVALLNWALLLSLANTLPPALSVSMPGFSFPFALLLAGLGAFVLAEVFAYGARLHEDVEATI
jgi:hypothetical protein